MEECAKKCEVYSRIVGYFRPVANWNIGKKEEFKDRLEFDLQKAMTSEFAKDNCAVIEEGSLLKQENAV
jgi:ribonucleoside-triphosphate reductase (formate)